MTFTTEKQRSNNRGVRPSAGRVAVLMGGKSAEREISLLSGHAVLNGLLTKGVNAFAIDVDEHLVERLLSERIDKVFNMLHGRGGEDGLLQGLLEMMGISYTGSGVLASALSMDKIKTKMLWSSMGLPTPRSSVLGADSDWEGLIRDMGELVVKPSHEGSSIGMSMVKTAAELKAAYEKASAFDTEVMAEQRIRGAEFTVPVIHGQVFPAIEMRTHHEFYDFDAKYLANDTEYFCPAPLSAEKTSELQEICLRAFNAVGARDWGRIDVMQDQTGQFWLLELNTVPGMTDHSLVPMSAAALGMSFGELVVHILDGVNDGGDSVP
ncbi:MAG: D-alanine--D-alanine ligase [Pseudohongiella sp.]|nr:D-alanine--D-alanine ligase [Pseudohongiella sp.]MDO9520885.1 D-alanine--D-alanine ligase [Pseudohongiella sp.]MDP2128052.1 D-alanine--D-alanine ligase [Pseudohongiella sp.]